MRQKDENDKKEKLQSQKALYEKYERMRGMQETIVMMAASGYDGEYPVLEHMRSSLSAYTTKYEAMRNEHEQKYGPFNPLNPYSANTSNSGGLVNAVQQSAGFSDLDDDTKNEVFKRYEEMRAKRGKRLESIKGSIGSFKYRQDISALKMSRALHPDDVETYNEQVQDMQRQIDEATSRLEAVQERLNGFGAVEGGFAEENSVAQYHLRALNEPLRTSLACPCRALTKTNSFKIKNSTKMHKKSKNSTKMHKNKNQKYFTAHETVNQSKLTNTPWSGCANAPGPAD